MSITRQNIKDILPDIDDNAMKSLLSLIHSEVDTLRDANDDLQNKLKTAQEETNAANAAKDKAEKDLTDYKSAQDAKETKSKKEAAYKALLKENGVADKFVNLILKATDVSGYELSEDGKLKNADTISESIKTEHADFISRETKTGAGAETPPSGNSGKKYSSKNEILAIKDTGERQQAIADNHELFGF